MFFLPIRPKERYSDSGLDIIIGIVYSTHQNLYVYTVFSQNSNLEKKVLLSICLHRGSYMSAHVLLNLLNKLRKRDKMQGLLIILSFFFATSLINSKMQEHEC